eukprot:9102922-Pyramimonas_sp.AAC.1
MLQVRVHALRVCQNLARASAEGREGVRQAGGVPAMLDLLGSPDPEVAAEAATGLAEVALDPRSAAIVHTNGGLQKLFAL